MNRMNAIGESGRWRFHFLGISRMSKHHFVVVPFEQLSPEALQGVLEAYVNREGTDYGHKVPLTLSEKVGRIRRQLQEGSAVIVFDADHQSCNILPRHKLPPESIL